MSTNSELMALLTKMGGTPTEQDTNSDLIKKIKDIWDGFGSSETPTSDKIMFVKFTREEEGS